jgi:hypothetical protein
MSTCKKESDTAQHPLIHEFLRTDFMEINPYTHRFFGYAGFLGFS